MPLPIVDTRSSFRPLAAEIVVLLRALPSDSWQQPTMAGAWRVRDVVAHMIDTALRRLSLHRDRYAPAERPGPTPEDLLAFINDLNATWVRAAHRLSPHVLTDLYARVGAELSDFMETLELDADALWPVSWAGDARSPQWLDIGREFTEVWHHGQQIRDAVGAGPFADPRWLRAVLEIAMHVMPHAYRDVAASSGARVEVRITGRSSGVWTIKRETAGWSIEEGGEPGASATATMTDETAWRLLFNALPPAEAGSHVRVEGDATLARPLLRARAVIVGEPRG